MLYFVFRKTIPAYKKVFFYLPCHSVWCRQGINPRFKMHLSTLHNSDEFASIMGHIKERMLCRDEQITVNNFNLTVVQKHKCVK